MGLIIKKDNNYINLNDIGLCIKERPKIPTPSQRLKTIEIKGRDGSLTVKDGFSDIEFSVELNLLEDDAKKILRNFKSIIFNTTEISFTDDNKYFYKVKNVEIDDIENEVSYYGSFIIKFRCEPFIYSFTSHTFTQVSNKIIIQGYKALPLIKITPYSTGQTVSFEIDRKRMTINSATNPIFIDCDLMRIYGETQSLLEFSEGDFFELGNGVHDLNLISGIAKFEIQTREGWL